MYRLDIHIDWKAFVAGDERVLERVYNAFFDALFNYGCRFTSDTELVEDAIQDLFVRFWKNRANLKEPPSLRNYLFKAFRNHMQDRLKSQERYVIGGFDQDHSFEAVPSAEETQMASEEMATRTKRLKAVMSELTDRQREAIFLRFYEEFSYPEIAAMMGITVKATYKLMARSIDVMRNGLGEDMIGLFLLLWRKPIRVKNR